MSAIITHDAGTITPTAVSSYEAEQAAGNIVHDVLGRAHPDITFRPAGLRTGTLTLTFASAVDANAARLALATGTVFELVAPEQPTIDMAYVVAGTIGTVLGAALEWTLLVGFQEVLP